MNYKSYFKENLIYKGLQLIVGIIILIFAHIIAKIVSNTLMKMGRNEYRKENTPTDGITQQEYTDQLAKTNLIFLTIGNMSYYAILLVAFFIVLRVLGIESTSLIALLGTTGLAIGLAIQGTLSDIASGVLLAIFQTYSIGEVIEVDNRIGKVIDFTILNTVLEEVDTGTVITIPNRKIQDSIIQNHTRNPIRYLIYKLAVSNKPINMVKLQSTLTEILGQIKGVLKDPAPTVDVDDVTSSATILQFRVAIESKYYTDLLDPIRTKIREILIAEKVELRN